MHSQHASTCVCVGGGGGGRGGVKYETVQHNGLCTHLIVNQRSEVTSVSRDLSKHHFNTFAARNGVHELTLCVCVQNIHR